MNSTIKNTPRAEALESLRFKSDMRQFGALLMLTGFCAIFQPLAGIATAIGPDKSTVSSGLPLSGFIGGLCLVTIGIVSIVAGYSQAVHDMGHKHLTLAAIILTQTAFIPYITDMTSIGRAASSAMLIPADYNDASKMDNNFVGACGILGVLAYGFTFVGSISFMQFSLYAYQTGKSATRNASYYRGRMGFYCGMLFIAGLSQLLLGSYIGSRFGAVELSVPIGVAMYVVNFPVFSILVGAIQILNAVWGLARFKNLFGLGECKNTCLTYQISIFAGWMLQFLLQVILQVGYLPGGAESQALAAITALSFGLNMMPAYLDYKARTVPEVIGEEYYFSSDSPDESVPSQTVDGNGEEQV